MDKEMILELGGEAEGLEELRRAMETLPGDTPDITEEYAKIQRVYQAVFAVLLRQTTGLDRLDQRLADQGVGVGDQESRGFFQRYDLLGLRYFYLRTLPRVERLGDQERKRLEVCLTQSDDEVLRAAAETVKDTYATVMAARPDQPETWFELYPTIHGEGLVQGKEIALAMTWAPAFDSEGRLLDPQGEREKAEIMARVKEQLEPILRREIANIKVLLLP